MIAGHFTTALIAKQKFPKGTLLYFLIISQLQDFLWFTFHYLGLEPTNPGLVLGLYVPCRRVLQGFKIVLDSLLFHVCVQCYESFL